MFAIEEPITALAVSPITSEDEVSVGGGQVMLLCLVLLLFGAIWLL